MNPNDRFMWSERGWNDFAKERLPELIKESCSLERDGACAGLECTKVEGEAFANVRKSRVFVSYELKLSGKLVGHGGDYDVTGSWSLACDSSDDKDEWTYKYSIVTPSEEGDAKAREIVRSILGSLRSKLNGVLDAFAAEVETKMCK